MYPRMLELEKEKKMETQTAYYYRNLSQGGLRHLAKKLDIELKELKTQDFREFKRKAAYNLGKTSLANKSFCNML